MAAAGIAAVVALALGPARDLHVHDTYVAYSPLPYFVVLTVSLLIARFAPIVARRVRSRSARAVTAVVLATLALLSVVVLVVQSPIYGRVSEFGVLALAGAIPAFAVLLGSVLGGLALTSRDPGAASAAV